VTRKRPGWGIIYPLITMKTDKSSIQSHVFSFAKAKNSPPPFVLGCCQCETKEWSPHTKAHLRDFAKDKCKKYHVPFKEQVAIIAMSQVCCIVNNGKPGITESLTSAAINPRNGNFLVMLDSWGQEREPRLRGFKIIALITQ
jgi:hypothetical protein